VRYLILQEVLYLHRQIIAQTGGMPGILNSGALESALAQPRMATRTVTPCAAPAGGLFQHPVRQIASIPPHAEGIESARFIHF
jgi:hypothetical protein